MKKEEVIAMLEEGGDAEWVLRKAEEDQAYIENYATEKLEKGIKSYEGKLHQKYDDDFFTLTGKRRSPEERTFDFIKREWTANAEKARQADELIREKQELEKKIKDGSTDKKLLADLEAVQKEYQRVKEESENKIKTMQTEHERFKIRSEILSAMSGMNFNDKIPASALEAFKERVINDLVMKAEYREGQLFFVDKDGNPLRNQNNALNPYTAREILGEQLKEVLKEKRSQSGPPVSDEINKEYDEKGNLKKVAIVVPDSIRTKEQLGEFLISKGLLRGTPEYYKAYGEYGKNLPIR